MHQLPELCVLQTFAVTSGLVLLFVGIQPCSMVLAFKYIRNSYSYKSLAASTSKQRAAMLNMYVKPTIHSCVLRISCGRECLGETLLAFVPRDASSFVVAEY